MLWKVSRVLALAPHADDIEFGAGGLISRLINDGAEIHTAVFSIARESVPAEFPQDILRYEVQEASAILGIPTSNVRIMDYPVRRFPQYRQEILEELVKLRRELMPQLILVHAST